MLNWGRGRIGEKRKKFKRREKGKVGEVWEWG